MNQFSERHSRYKMINAVFGHFSCILAGQHALDPAVFVAYLFNPGIADRWIAIFRQGTLAMFPHHARAQPWVEELLNQSCDYFPFEFPSPNKAFFTAVLKDKFFIRCAAQSAEISLQGIPQTFSV